MTTVPSVPRDSAVVPRWGTAAIASIYTAIAAAITWPLLRDMRTLVASDPGDPLLNASILQWNATTVPFSPAWWNAPHFYPSTGVVTFTENLLGLSPLASPIYWLTGNPILAYNLVTFITWPLSALSAYLLVRFLTRRQDAAFLAGLAFGFTPYRVPAFGHLQTLATFGVPLCLLGMHGYLDRRCGRWLVLVGLAWLFQSLANGYYILYGGLLVGLWLVYFGSTRDRWRPSLAIIGALGIASLPLVPLLLTYRGVHQHYGLRRSFNEILYFSARPESWFGVGEGAWFWQRFLPQGRGDLFPGLTVVAVTVVGIGYLLLRRRRTVRDETTTRRAIRIALGCIAVLSAVALLGSLRYGQVDTTLAGVPFKMRDVTRALTLFLLSSIPLAWLTPRAREALERRRPLPFYAVATIVVALLSCGPILRVGEEVIWKAAPYGWLMMLPGFDELRVPTQLKMIDMLCLSVSAGLAYAACRPTSRRAAAPLFVVVALGIMVDGWMVSAPMAQTPPLWPAVEPHDRPEPILELPLGPAHDFAATLRAASHHRRVMNGVSGYDPPHYVALKAGLAAHDPALLAAIATLGAFDIVVNRDADPDGAHERYAASAPGAIRVLADGARSTYRVPRAGAAPSLGPALPIASVRAVRQPEEARLMADGLMDTGWGDYPQQPDQWVIADLGAVHDVGGVTHAIGEFQLDFPRRLAIELSFGGERWDRAWEGPTFAPTFLGFVRAPRASALHVSFTPQPARYVRLRQLEAYASLWRISELQIHGPSPSP